MPKIPNRFMRKFFPYAHGGSDKDAKAYTLMLSKWSFLDQYAWAFLYAYMYNSIDYSNFMRYCNRYAVSLPGVEAYRSRHQNEYIELPTILYDYKLYNISLNLKVRNRSIYTVCIFARNNNEALTIAYRAFKSKGLLIYPGQPEIEAIKLMETRNGAAAARATITFFLSHILENELVSGYFPPTKRNYMNNISQLKFTPCNVRQIWIDEILHELEQPV